MQTHRKAVSFAALLMAASVLLTGCASQEIQARKAAIAAASATQPEETPAPTLKPTAAPIDRWSLLDNLPDFAVGTLPAPIITWVDGLPLGENPLTYEDGQHIDGLFSNASGGSIQLSDVSVEDLKDTPVNVRMNMTLSVLDDTATPTSNSSDASSDTSVTDFCLHTKGSDGGQAFYYQIGYNGNYPMDILNGALAIENNLTFGEAFDNGLYYSSATPDEFAGYPEEGTPKDQINFLYSTFGTPSGLYWADNVDGVQYGSFEEFHDAEYDKDNGAKHFYLIWNFEKCTIAAACSDDFSNPDVLGTTINEIYEFPILTGTDYVKESTNNFFWGYLGYGDAPIRLIGLYAEVPTSKVSVIETEPASESAANAETQSNNDDSVAEATPDSENADSAADSSSEVTEGNAASSKSETTSSTPKINPCVSVRTAYYGKCTTDTKQNTI